MPRVVFSVALVFALTANRAHADGPISADGTAIGTSDYSIDLFRGPVIGTTRMIGLGGAFVAIAEGVEGGLTNPAAVAHRQAQWPDWYDYWLAFGLTYPFNAGDFYNSGDSLVENGDEIRTDERFLFFIPGFSFQFWNAGIGLTIESQITRVDVEAPDGTTNRIEIGFPVFHVQGGYGFWNNQVIVGGGVRFLLQRVKLGNLAPDGRRVSYKNLGIGGEVGIMIRPNGKRWRLGASLYPRLRTQFNRRGSGQTTPEGDLVIGDLFLPRRVEDPTRGSIGFSWQFGPRPTNPRWIHVEEFAGEDLVRIDERIARVEAAREKEIDAARKIGGAEAAAKIKDIEDLYERKLDRLEAERKNIKYAAWKILRERVRTEWPRHYLLLSTELLIVGRVSSGVGVESFVTQIVQRSGQEIGFSPRIGIEAEPWQNRLKMRAGVYMEPSRFKATKPRVHGTFGFDLKMFRWNVFGLWPEDYLWDLKLAFDFARDYSSVSFSIGGWY